MVVPPPTILILPPPSSQGFPSAPVFGPIGGLLGLFAVFLFGGIIGGYYGSVLGEKVVLAHPEFVANFAHRAEELYDGVEDMIETEIRKIRYRSC